MSKNSCCNSEIYKKWLKEIFFNYELFTVKQKCYLILDKAPFHIDKEIINFLNENQTIYSLIPSGMTRFLQPFDLRINKPFKNYLKNEYLNYITDLLSNNKVSIESEFQYNKVFKNLTKSDIDKQNIIKLVYNIFYNDNKIKPQSIVNSFKKTGISLLSDCYEEHLFEIPDEIRNCV
jgi:hypothetical protein